MFQACLVFIRDLWMTDSSESTEVIRPHPMVSADAPTPFPIIDKMLKDLGMNEANTAEPDSQKGKVISQTTRITFRVNPEAPDAAYDNDAQQQFLDDAMRMVMGNMEEKREPESAPFFGNFPFFGGPSSPVHPKLIIVKKISPSSFPANQDDLVKSVLDGPEAPSDESMFPFGRSNPFSIFSPFRMVRPVETMPNNLEQYEKIVKEMDSSSAKILNHTEELEALVKKQLEAPANDAKIAYFFASSSANLKKIETNLKFARQVIKAELEYLKSSTEGVKNLVERVKSYHSALSIPLSVVFEASADLTNTGELDRKIEGPVFDSIISLGRELINFGKLIYEDVKALEERLTQNGQDLDQIFKINARPVVRRRLIIFRSPEEKPEAPKESVPAENSETKKLE